MLNLLLLDTDVIINLHELGIWEAILKKYNVYVASTVIHVEAVYYEDKKTHEKMKIDLRDSVAKKLIHEICATAEEQKRIKDLLSKKRLAYIVPDAGELEAMAIVNEKKIEGLQFCTVDDLAQKIMVHLGLETDIVAFETVLKELGVLRRNQQIASSWTEKKLAHVRTNVRMGIL
ncbi:MAG: hypothetical protein HQL22_02865 [Candidatus Omnitrophica bacterium]|nr:hypothetical protein [Candidatus Omnitrophota bacterium]